MVKYLVCIQSYHVLSGLYITSSECFWCSYVPFLAIRNYLLSVWFVQPGMKTRDFWNILNSAFTYCVTENHRLSVSIKTSWGYIPWPDQDASKQSWSEYLNFSCCQVIKMSYNELYSKKLIQMCMRYVPNVQYCKAVVTWLLTNIL